MQVWRLLASGLLAFDVGLRHKNLTVSLKNLTVCLLRVTIQMVRRS